MKTIWKSLAVATMMLSGFSAICVAQTKATLRLDPTTKHQHITGFGGFVCSPQFQYNHMSNAEIEKVWGKNSTVGCNIMRLYLPIGRNSWQQSLATAKKAKQMGLIVFASPWGQPAEWKTNGTSNAKNDDGTTGKLKRENWADYAKYLEDYVQYLRKNGVELDAISIQNEPDWPASYAGCLWSADEMAEFVKTYGKTISCKVIAPETIGVSDSYVNALNKTGILDGFDIYGGHQYGGIQSAYKNLAKKNKELWMTEFLINWNENKSESESRNFDFSQDFFDFFNSINTCMLGDFNAWIHYASKRYYGMLGDGQRGTSNGVVTKRGYIMAHFARFVTGMTRIDASWTGGSMGSSAYLSQTGDTVVAVMANTGDDNVTLTVDLPFYTEKGEFYTTDKSKNMVKTAVALNQETCRPVVEVVSKSVCTVLFVRSRDRQPSNMKGSVICFDRIDDMKPTKTTFGSNYKLSGTTKTFDASNPLISSRTNMNYGYVALDNRYQQLVMHIKKVTSTNSLTMGAPTLIYVNSEGTAQKHEYERIDLNRGQDFDVVLDLSSATLADGCIGIIAFTCDNAVSKLTINFGDVYFTNGTSYAATLSGSYVDDDSNVLEYTSDAGCASLDLTGVTNLPAELPWLEGTNRIVYVTEGNALTMANVVKGTVCQNLNLSTDGGEFRPVKAFTAESASLTVNVEGAQLLMLPFEASIPEGVKVYILAEDMSLQEITSIPAHQPMLVEANGAVTFTGSGEVTYATSPMTAFLRGTYVQLPIYAGDYLLGKQGNEWGLVRQTSASTMPAFGVYAQPSSTASFIPIDLSADAIEDVKVANQSSKEQYYDLQGRRIANIQHVRKGQVVIVHTADGAVRKMLK